MLGFASSIVAVTSGLYKKWNRRISTLVLDFSVSTELRRPFTSGHCICGSENARVQRDACRDRRVWIKISPSVIRALNSCSRNRTDIIIVSDGTTWSFRDLYAGDVITWRNIRETFLRNTDMESLHSTWESPSTRYSFDGYSSITCDHELWNIFTVCCACSTATYTFPIRPPPPIWSLGRYGQTNHGMRVVSLRCTVHHDARVLWRYTYFGSWIGK